MGETRPDKSKNGRQGKCQKIRDCVKAEPLKGGAVGKNPKGGGKKKKKRKERNGGARPWSTWTKDL